MDPYKQFQSESRQRIAEYGEDEAFQSLSREWLEQSMKRRYVYNFEFMGRPIIQYPQDMVALQELIWKVRPDLIIETGIAHGGSLVMSAAMLSLLDLADATASGQPLDPRISGRKVVGIDIDIRTHNREAIEAHPMAGRIEMIEGSSIDPVVVEKVREIASRFGRILVCLDSMHTHGHVLEELKAYAPLVTPGSYCIVFDTFVEDMPPGFFEDRPWDVGNNPKTAVRQFLESNPDFESDLSMQDKLMVTVAPEGYLLRR